MGAASGTPEMIGSLLVLLAWAERMLPGSVHVSAAAQSLNQTPDVFLVADVFCRGSQMSTVTSMEEDDLCPHLSPR